jgi:hypothetical protein
MAARSILLEWDTLLSSYKTELAGKSTYKVDLLAKLWGGFIHEEYDTSADKQIALQLYKDAKDVLLKNYNVYSAYNNKAKAFDDNFEKLAKLPLDQVKAEYIDATPSAKELETFIDAKIAKLESNKKDNVVVVAKGGFVSPKRATRVIIGFGSLVTIQSEIDKAAKAGDEVYPLILPLDAAAHFTTNPDLAPVLALLGIAGGALPRIEFEVPSVPKVKYAENYTAVLKSKNDGKETALPLVLANPVSDIAYKAVDDKKAANLTVVGIKVVGLHAAAITAAKVAYDAGKKKGMNDFVLKASVVAAYKAASVGINQMTKADLRYWSSLNGSVRLGGANVPDGNYLLSVKDGKGGVLYKQEVVVKNGETTFIDVNI